MERPIKSSFLLYFCKDFLIEEILGSLGRERIQLVIQGDVDAVYTVAHAEGAAQLHLVLQVVPDTGAAPRSGGNLSDGRNCQCKLYIS